MRLQEQPGRRIILPGGAEGRAVDETSEGDAGPEAGAGREVQAAEVEISGGRLRLRASVRVTPAGLLAIGALVSGILLSTTALVWASTGVARRHPLATRLRPR